MKNADSSRRLMLQGLALTLGIAGMEWPALARAAHDAHAAARAPTTTSYTQLDAADAAEIEALTSQIIPSDATPGAREAGVSYFIDLVLAGILSHCDLPFRKVSLNSVPHAALHCPDAASFAVLAPDRQMEFLRTDERTPFFDQVGTLTSCGMLSMPNGSCWGSKTSRP